MKKVILIICVFIIVVLCTGYSNKLNNNLSLLGKTIVIDAGHGGKDPGTISNNIYEKDLNLSISRVLQKYLEYNGAMVIMIRNDDYDLSYPNATFRKKSDFDNRIKIINQNNVDLYISIHMNYLNDKKYYGPQIFYGDKKLASILKRNLKTNRRNKPIPTHTYMYKKLKPRGVLVECGFMSNEKELKKLQSTNYQQFLAYNITKSIIEYYS